VQGPDTTYRFYAQLQSDVVFEELDRMFMPEGVASNLKTHPAKHESDSNNFLIPEENQNAG
jgi:hypothetical protein